eukprot:CAMPEP_0174368320 /NCGR_PEP_ID=MMETSP0811_2-20130205/88630_1 /TAXON_ID=73025 ORGANISM="Eutreptiella gymnastica-like, Strain CCMP1594" /NCGR_SAMPLE_ID=MMETSP0811_2 /ASSEMBLY_ACC=CAM_ASM_000667 /LENGTH=53 /DNA_ID=CAMNT_0015511721 /DNA_START=303 /DNA_END=460 /DNA_ORIENTATION=-
MSHAATGTRLCLGRGRSVTEMGQGQNGEGEMGWGSDCLRSPPPAQEMPWTPGT